jgi:acyl-CoA reductase-like NAD-dependent aldehyde dehydrogenase
MKEEIFGPIIPILTYSAIEECVDYISNDEKPLVVYFFGEKNGANQQKVADGTSSGAFVVNEMILQVANPNLPFGGVGYSGYGRCNGI